MNSYYRGRHLAMISREPLSLQGQQADFQISAPTGRVFAEVGKACANGERMGE